MRTRILCPNCGTSFELPENESVCMGMTIGKDSGLGDIYLKPESKQTSRLDCLKANGVDVSKYFSLFDGDNNEVVMKKENGKTVMVEDTELESMITEDGYVRNTRLFRRWVMGQMFHMLNSESGFTKALHRKGWKYSFEMVIEELRVQAILYDRDRECYKERSHFFPNFMVGDMCKDYVKELERIVKYLPIRPSRKGEPSKVYMGRNYGLMLVSEIEPLVLAPLRNQAYLISHEPNPHKLWHEVSTFYEMRAKFSNARQYSQKMSQNFINMYKGSGAYYTMKNMLLFHGCFIYKNGEKLYGNEGLKYLRDTLAVQKQGWELFGIMKEFIEYNDFDYEARLKELGYR